MFFFLLDCLCIVIFLSVLFFLLVLRYRWRKVQNGTIAYEDDKKYKSSITEREQNFRDRANKVLVKIKSNKIIQPEGETFVDEKNSETRRPLHAATVTVAGSKVQCD